MLSFPHAQGFPIVDEFNTINITRSLLAKLFYTSLLTGAKTFFLNRFNIKALHAINSHYPVLNEGMSPDIAAIALF